jgi:hypothetical protein
LNSSVVKRGNKFFENVRDPFRASLQLHKGKKGEEAME